MGGHRLLPVTTFRLSIVLKRLVVVCIKRLVQIKIFVYQISFHKANHLESADPI